MQPRLSVQVLSLEPQVLLSGFLSLRAISLVQRMDGLVGQALDVPLFTDRTAPGLVTRLPHQLPLGIGEFLRHAYLVGVEVVDVAQLGVRACFLRRAYLRIQCFPVLGFERVVRCRWLGLMVFRLLALVGSTLAAIVSGVFWVPRLARCRAHPALSVLLARPAGPAARSCRARTRS